jgi:hypothetical protein
VALAKFSGSPEKNEAFKFLSKLRVDLQVFIGHIVKN